MLPQALFADPTFLVRAGREQRLFELWERSAEFARKVIRDLDVSAEEKAVLDVNRYPPDGFNCALIDIGGRSGALVEMPQALRPMEAIYAVVVHEPSSRPNVDSRPGGIRYFILERGTSVNGAPMTFLAEWTRDGRHVNFGEAGPLMEAAEDARFGPVDRQIFRRVSRDAFIEAVDELLRAGKLISSETEASPDALEGELEEKEGIVDQNLVAALHRAAGQGQVAEVARLLRNGAPVDGRIDEGETALHKAARGGHIETARHLLEAGADLNTAEEFGITALYFAVDSNQLEMCRFLIDCGADVDARQRNGATALLQAVGYERHDIAVHLIQHGADVNAQDLRGYTATILASLKRDTELVRLLVAQGADVNRVVLSGRGPSLAAEVGRRSAIAYALLFGEFEIAEILESAGASRGDFNADDGGGESLVNG